MNLISTSRAWFACALIASLLLLTASYAPADEAETIDFAGDLDAGDSTLDRTGEFYDEHLFDVDVGQAVVVDLRSTEFDPYLILQSPSGERWDNDDWQDDRTLSRIQVTADAAGRWRILVTSYEAGETGDYTGQVRIASSAATVTDSSTSDDLTNFTGVLTSDSPTLNTTGGYFGEHTFWADAGQALSAEMRSSDLVTYVILISPSGESWGNDDWEDSRSVSRVDVIADATGSWRLIATSYEPGETGAYHAQVRMSESPVMAHSGSLGDGDEQLTSGEWADIYPLDGRSGEYVVLNMTSTDLDTYLILVGPDGEEQWENDDHEGNERRSQIAMELPEDGQYRVFATTYEPGETGSYELSVRRMTDSPSGPSGGDGVIYGELADGDDTLSGEEFVDSYTIEGRPGNNLRIDLQSGDFDTYLLVRTPTGEQFVNDDFEEQTNRSFLELSVSEAGTYSIGVTSYEAGETGEYELRMTQVEGSPIATADEQRDARLVADRPVRGVLDSDDGTLPGGEFHDTYTFDVAAGQTLKIDMTSSEFDTYLAVALPSRPDEWLQNDDFESDRDESMSRIEVTAEQGGRVRLIATSYEAGETGSYELTVFTESGPTTVGDSTGRRVRGVFVGISEYERMGSLDLTAEDAMRAHAALQAGGGMRDEDAALLLDDQATRGAVESAVQRIGGACQPGDLFVFFYSGHGGFVDVPASRRGEREDSDGLDETLCFYDRDIIDNDFSEMLAVIDEGVTVMVVLDSCFSGGFAKDVICKPGYLGLFSSEERVTSMVAGKFRAGGYLAHFFAQAVAERRADSRPEDQSITAFELVQYISEEYREHVRGASNKSGSNDMYVSPGVDLGYQHFVSDWASVGPNHRLFAW